VSAYGRRMVLTFQIIAGLIILVLWWTDAIPAFVAGILIAVEIGAAIWTNRALKQRSDSRKVQVDQSDSGR